jgi:hypothetical protein
VQKAWPAALIVQPGVVVVVVAGRHKHQSQSTAYPALQEFLVRSHPGQGFWRSNMALSAVFLVCSKVWPSAAQAAFEQTSWQWVPTAKIVNSKQTCLEHMIKLLGRDAKRVEITFRVRLALNQKQAERKMLTTYVNAKYKDREVI